MSCKIGGGGGARCRARSPSRSVKTPSRSAKRIRLAPDDKDELGGNCVGSMDILEFAKFGGGIASALAFRHLGLAEAREPIVLAARDLRLICESPISSLILPLFLRLGGRFVHSCIHMQHPSQEYTSPACNNLSQCLHIDPLLFAATEYSKSVLKETNLWFPTVIAQLVVGYVAATEWHHFFLHPSSSVPSHLATPLDFSDAITL